MSRGSLTLTAPQNFLSKNYLWNIFGSDFCTLRKLHDARRSWEKRTMLRGIAWKDCNFWWPTPPEYMYVSTDQEWPRQTKPKKVSSWTFRRGVPEQKFNVNRACFPKEKHQNSQKWAKFMNFSFWPFLRFGLPGRLLNWTVFRSRGKNWTHPRGALVLLAFGISFEGKNRKLTRRGGRPKVYHPGRNCYKIIPLNNYFCNILVVFFKVFLAECRVFLYSLQN